MFVLCAFMNDSWEESFLASKKNHIYLLNGTAMHPGYSKCKYKSKTIFL